MAPQKNQKKLADQYVKESLLFKHCQKGVVPSSYIGLHSCERNFGFKYNVRFYFSFKSKTDCNIQDLTLSEVKQVVWGVRCGQQGYFLSPEVMKFALPI